MKGVKEGPLAPCCPVVSRHLNLMACALILSFLVHPSAYLQAPLVAERADAKLARWVLNQHGVSMTEKIIKADYKKCDELLCDGASRSAFIESKCDRIAAWREAAEAGDDRGQILYGLSFFYGHGVEEDERTAVQWFQKAADQGNAHALCSLGLCYQFGWGVEKDAALAATQLQNAARQGHPGALRMFPQEVLSNSLGMKLASLPPGTFEMGSSTPVAAMFHEDEQPAHMVKITRPFLLGVFPVTQRQYNHVMGVNPSQFRGDDHPVENVSWDDAVAFCDALSSLPEEQDAGRVYRLPTEAEWEYACRSGGIDALPFAQRCRLEFEVNFPQPPDLQGVELFRVQPFSPANDAGINVDMGDVLVRIADKPINDLQDYALAIDSIQPGDRVEIVIRRNGVEVTEPVLEIDGMGSTKAGPSLSHLWEHAWCRCNAGHTTHPVGQKKLNSWGLHDMLGNVQEWCADWYVAYRKMKRPQKDPVGGFGKQRVLRGGSWATQEDECRPSSRFVMFPNISRADDNVSTHGFRVAASVNSD